MYNSYNKYKQKYLNLKKLTGGSSASIKSSTVVNSSPGINSAVVNSSTGVNNSSNINNSTSIKSSTGVGATSTSVGATSTSVGVTNSSMTSSAQTFIPKTLQDIYSLIPIIDGPECFNIDINNLNTNANYIFDLEKIDPTKITLESVKCGLTFIDSKINSLNPIPYKEFTRTKLIIDGMNLSFNSDL